MRSTLILLGSLLWAHAAQAAGLRDLNLPELGDQRHAVLAEMRRQGMKLVDGEGNRMLFEGAPLGWPGVKQSLFTFDGVTLQQIELVFEVPQSDEGTSQSFHELRTSLATKLGAPWFDRARDPKNKRKGVTTLALHGHATTWLGGRHKVSLASVYGASRKLSVAVVPHVPIDDRELVGPEGEAAPWAARGLSEWTKTVRLTAAALLDDFGEQRMLVRGAKVKGKPLTVHLRKVTIPEGLTGVDRDVVQRRFDNFVDGHWDLLLSPSSRDADIELDVAIVSVEVNGQTSYAMKVEAYVAKGQERGEVLYTASQLLK